MGCTHATDQPDLFKILVRVFMIFSRVWGTVTDRLRSAAIAQGPGREYNHLRHGRVPYGHAAATARNLKRRVRRCLEEKLRKS